MPSIVKVCEGGRGSRSDRLLFLISVISMIGGNCCTLTIDNQSRHTRSITKGVIVWFDFKDVEGVCPVEVFFFGGPAFVVEEDKVGREVKFVEHPSSELLRVIDTIVLRDAG